MKRRILIIFILLTTFITIACTIALTKVYYDFYSNNIKEELRIESSIIENILNTTTVSDKTYNKVLQDIDADISRYTRITLIENDGTVIFDSQADVAALENHADRTEIIAAQENGSGEAIRYSATLGKDAYYYALKLNDGSYLRLSRQLESIWTVFSSTIPLLTGIIILILIFSFYISSRLTKIIINPVIKATEKIDSLLDRDENNIYNIPVYEELIPFIQKIKQQKGKINQQIRSLENERDKINSISHNMREGLILLDKNKHIISINNSALMMFQASTAIEYRGDSVFKLTRNIELLTALENTLANNEEISFTSQNHDDHYLRYYLSPVNINDKSKSEGVMIFILDVSNETRADKIRRDFAANVSHELKTPLTSINGFAEMIAGGMLKNDTDIKKSAASIQKEAKRLLVLINDIMRLSEIESGIIKQDTMENINLADILNEVLLSLDHALKAKSISLETAADDVMIKANRQMAFELFFNLIDNAIKYNKENGNITVKIQNESGQVKISVSDTGIGIAPKDQERIFERFYRVDKSRSKQSGGTGLGLSIVKHIVEYHQGDLSISSSPDQGTTVTVLLPVNS